MIENGTLLQDRYLIEKKIGAGGMGAVYLAVDQRFENHVAIKETFYTDDELGEAFEREARLLNGLHHPVLPHVSDYFTENNKYFLVMQYIEGDDLSAILKREGAFPIQGVLRWLNQLLDGLDYLHSQEPPIIHRDIKPQNLKLTPRGDVILLDFGLAKLKSEDTTGAHSVFGYSKKYSPLEQIQGTGTDARSDIFSLGATAYHLLTGKPPIDVLARASEIVVGNPDPLKLASELNSEIPLSVANILNSALALNPAERFASAKAMQRALTHTIETNSEISTEKLPKEIAEEIPAVKPVIFSPEAEEFPALEAFAADVMNSERGADGEQKTEVSDEQILNPNPAPAFEIPIQQTSIVESPTKIAATRAKKPSFLVAAVIALLVCFGLAAGYFINKAKKTANSNQIPISQTTPEINSSETQTEITPESKISDEPVSSQTIEQAKTKPIEIEKTSQRIQKKETVVEPEEETKTVEKTVNAPVQNEPKRQNATVQTAKRTEPKRQNSNQPRAVESEPLPDIESIFTGRPNPDYERIHRQKRGQQRGEMTEEEWQEMRRQRRMQRRQRQNNLPLPF